VENQEEISTMHQKIDYVIGQLSRLSDLMDRQSLPTYNDVAFNYSDAGKSWGEGGDSASYEHRNAVGYPGRISDADEVDSYPNLSKTSLDRAWNSSGEEENEGPDGIQEHNFEGDWEHRKPSQEANQQRLVPWAPAVAAGLAAALWLGSRLALRR
jgi:hypothetical protein